MITSSTATLVDPLLSMRRVVRWIFGLQLVLAGVDVFSALTGLQSWMSIGVALPGLLVSAGLLKHVLPSGPPDLIYLRSFQADKSRASARLRRMLETAAHPLRVAGVREPGRRWPMLLRPLLYTAFIWTYAANRRMNLESGADWRERLLHNLVRCRAVVVDYRAPTAFVTEELGMALAQSGAQRLWVLVGPQQPDDEVLAQCRAAGVVLQTWSEQPEQQRQAVAGFVDFLRRESPAPQPIHAALVEAARQRSGQSAAQLAGRIRRDRWLYRLGWVAVVGLLLLFWAAGAMASGSGAHALMLTAMALTGVFSTSLAAAWSWEHSARRRLHKRLGAKLADMPPQWPYLLWMATLLVLGVLGLLGASAFSAYSGYTARAQAMEHFMPRLQALNTALAEFDAEHQRLPAAAEMQALVDRHVPDPASVQVHDGQTVTIKAAASAPRPLAGMAMRLRWTREGDQLRRQCTPVAPQHRELLGFICRDGPP